MNPDEVNDIVSGDDYAFTCDERAEVALRSEVQAIAAKLSADEMREFVVMFSLACESEIRAIPDHPAIPLLDAYYKNHGTTS
jgi:hypothetical protein